MQYLTYKSQCPYESPTYCLYNGCNSPLHCHVDFYEFGLIINGAYRNIYKNQETLCSSGHLLFYKPGEAHELISDKPGSEHCSLIIKKDYFEEYFEKYWQSRQYCGDISTLPQSFSKEISGTQTIYLSQLASALAYNISPERRCISEQFLDTLLFALFNTIPIGSTVGIEMYINDSIRQFDAYKRLDMEIADICASYPITQRTFLEHFKRLTNYTMVEYRNIKRMEYAAHLLRKENYSIAAVSNMINVSCQSYFIKQFKKQFGMTPKQYQMLHRKNK